MQTLKTYSRNHSARPCVINELLCNCSPKLVKVVFLKINIQPQFLNKFMIIQMAPLLSEPQYQLTCLYQLNFQTINWLSVFVIWKLKWTNAHYLQNCSLQDFDCAVRSHYVHSFLSPTRFVHVLRISGSCKSVNSLCISEFNSVNIAYSLKWTLSSCL